MDQILEAFQTGAGILWKALWALIFGYLMIDYVYALTRLGFPGKLAGEAREHAEAAEQQEGGDQDMSEDEATSWTDKLTSRAGWRAIANACFMEWKVAYREILFGFTVAGFITVFVPDRVWNALLLKGDGGGSSMLALVENALVLSGVLYVCMVVAGLTVHALFALFGQIPTARPALSEQVHFAIDYTFWLNLVFLAIGAALLALHWRGGQQGHETAGDQRLAEQA